MGEETIGGIMTINDWATKAAEYWFSTSPSSINREARISRLAAIIDHFSKPITDLLRESRRPHESQCPAFEWADPEESDLMHGNDEPCRCGAEEWNARVDAALAGGSPPVKS